MTNAEETSILNELRQMRKLLEVMAEPAIAQRDAKLRSALRDIVGSSPKKQKSILLMDGTRTQAQIVTETAVSSGHLSTMVGQLESGGLLADGKKKPKLVISIPSNFFDADSEPKRR